MKWVCGFAGFVISTTLQQGYTKSPVSPLKESSDQAQCGLCHFHELSLEKAATGEKQKCNLVCRQWSVQTVGGWQSSPEDHAMSALSSHVALGHARGRPPDRADFGVTLQPFLCPHGN